ncbi:MAG: hypothetical protein ACJARD_000581 [Alphaproteobacteria bacterium]|jgi:hypothetical protein
MNPIYRTTHEIHFFVPTQDAAKKNYIALIKMNLSILQKLHNQNQKHKQHTLIDLSQIATILHTEKGTMNNPIRLETIHRYYKNYDRLTPTQQEMVA